MFLLMSSWSETTAIKDLSLPQRIGTVFMKAGVGITITSGLFYVDSSLCVYVCLLVFLLTYRSAHVSLLMT